MTGDNLSAKWSGKKMEGVEGLRTMECLRGRLLAERAASRVAKEETEQMGKKLTELENQLKTEIKSRNRAEKRLKFLLQKLESLNISYVSDESSDNNSSSLIEKSDFSSVSSTASSSNKQTQNYKKIQTTNFTNCEIKEPIKKIDSQASSTTSSVESHNCPSRQENLGTSEEGSSGNSYGSQCSQDEENLKSDDHRLKSLIGNEEDDKNGGNEHEEDDHIDNSLALVVIDPPVKEKEQAIDPIPIFNANVKDVLDALRYARETIQSSIQKRPMVRVGSR